MRNLLIATYLLASACTSAPGTPTEPPVLQVTSPERSLIQDHAGQLVVTGTVAPNEKGAAVSKVMVNNVPAVVGADGSWTAVVDIKPGATFQAGKAGSYTVGKDGEIVYGKPLIFTKENVDKAGF